MKGRNAQVARIYKILTLLELAPQGLSIGDLEHRLHDRGFEIGKRTIYRDLDALKAAGFPLVERGKSDDQATRWTLERTTRLGHNLILSARELMALYLARSALSPLKETPFFADLETTFNKIEDKLGQKSQSYLSDVSRELHFEPGSRWGIGLNQEVLETARAACAERQLLSVIYSSSNSGTTNLRTLGPHFLYFSKGSLYLVAEDMGDHVVKVFSVPRMSDAQMLDESYQGETVEPQTFFSSAFGVYHGNQSTKVRIQFGPKVARYIQERRWHETQHIDAMEGGCIELSLEVDLTPDLVQWILGFGSNAIVLEPMALIEKVHAEAIQTVQLYKDQKLAG